MSFKTGQVWADRDGNEITIESTAQANLTYTMLGRLCISETTSYTATGRYSAGGTCSKDLVKLIKDVSFDSSLNALTTSLENCVNTARNREDLAKLELQVKSSLEALACRYKEYSVVWEIDISSLSPEEAAKEAFNIMKDYCLNKIQKPVFKVDGVEIDLSKDDE